MDIKSVAVAAFTLILSNSTNASIITINEFLPNAIGADSGNEWIEFFNSSENSVDISSWGIQKATSTYSTFFTFPTGTMMPANEYLVIGGSNVTNADFNLTQLGLGNAGSSGDALRLLDNLSNVMDTVIYGPNNNDGFFDDLGNVAQSFASTPNAGHSIGRFTDGIDTDHSGNDFIIFDNPGLGSSNNLSTVPVPASAWLFVTGLIGLVGIARHKDNT